MAITPLPAVSKHLAANPYCVYYQHSGSDIRQWLVRQGMWWTEEQAGWIRNYLEIPPQFGDPLVAVMLCAVGDDKCFDDSTMWMSGQNEAGEFVKLEDLLYGDKGQVSRCRNAAYKLRDAVEWRAVTQVGLNVYPTRLAWPLEMSLYNLLEWANENGVQLTDPGAFAWRKACQTAPMSTSQEEPRNCPHSGWVHMYHWLRAVLGLLNSENDWPQERIRRAFEKLGDMERQYCRIPALCDSLHAGLTKKSYESGWTPELGMRLRAALKTMSCILDDTPAPAQDTLPATPPPQTSSKAGRKSADAGGAVHEVDFKREVIALIVAGHGDAEIARRMNEDLEDHEEGIEAAKIRAVRRWWQRNPNYSWPESGHKKGEQKK